ncbi:N-acetylmuramic acid 6-phosphate etherase [Acidipila sp. EB88]|uniref:N-acetylmuramic acid 6-phosphate etherase n=1 Tax=Acidipila sp. EB88 TaxID=2305226 RepID=UPI000F5EAD83|nr:N-acetylmuramic acid 6-phosphate etherase [Acidipila sp. EB88]RRA48203.1 N-acetylmuramic acid 6-phosphate etherase [Acidipila sp. EB88]
MSVVAQEALALLPTEGRNAATAEFDALGALGMMEAMHAADREAVAAVGAVLPAIASVVEAAAERLRGGGRLLYVGAGTSGRLGVLDASECPPTFHTPPEMVQGLIAGGERALRHAVEGAEDDAEQGAAVVRERGVSRLDVVVGVAASGRTPYVLGALRAARSLGALTVGVSCVPGSPVEQAAELPITVATGPEVVTGSTRLKAGTATKLVLNMISTGALCQLGYVHGNLMVNVQPTNAKLRDRAERIVAELTGLAREEAREALLQADGEVKTATVMARLGISAGAARDRLEQAGGVLRAALEA